MLKGTKTASELLAEEADELILMEKEDDIEKQRIKDGLLMIKIISLDKMGLPPLTNPRDLTTDQHEEFIKTVNFYVDIVNMLVKDYNEDAMTNIRDQFNKICLNKIFNTTDYSNFPVYKN
jgi:hypothetical protein